MRTWMIFSTVSIALAFPPPFPLFKMLHGIIPPDKFQSLSRSLLLFHAATRSGPGAAPVFQSLSRSLLLFHQYCKIRRSYREESFNRSRVPSSFSTITTGGLSFNGLGFQSLSRLIPLFHIDILSVTPPSYYSFNRSRVLSPFSTADRAKRQLYGSMFQSLSRLIPLFHQLPD